MPDELWTEIPDIVQDQDPPHGKEMQKAKWLSGEALQIAVKRREAKSKGENGLMICDQLQVGPYGEKTGS